MEHTKQNKPVAESARDSRRERMAVARLTGDTVTEIAKNEGVSRGWASAELNARETQAIIARLVDASSDRVAGTFDKALARIHEALAGC
jgi:hypothetical protein